MKKTQVLELFKNIKSTWVSFLSITVFIMLAVAIYTSISWSSDAVLNCVNNITDNTTYRDLEITYTYGFDDEDIEKLTENKYIDNAEGTYVAYATFDNNQETCQAKIMQANTEIDSVVSKVGKLPVKKNEIAVEKTWAMNNGLKIGDTIKFNSDNTGSARLLAAIYDSNKSGEKLDYTTLESKIKKPKMENLVTDEYTITALVEMPSYLNISPNNMGAAPTTHTAVNCVMLASEDAFDKTSYTGYPVVRLRSDDLRSYDTFSDNYQDEVEEIKDSIDPTVKTLTDAKTATMKKAVNKAVKYGDTKLEETKTKISSAKSQIKAGETKLKEAKAQISQGEELIKTAKSKLAAVEKKFAPYKKYLKYLDRIDMDTLKDDYNQLSDENKAKIKPYIKDAKAAYNAYVKYVRVTQKIETGEKKIADAKVKVQNGEEQIKVAKVKVKEAEKLYKEYSAQFDQFKTKAKNVDKSMYSILTRIQNAGIYSTEELGDVLDKLCYTMALLFVIVGLLVCYSAISRMVYNQLKQIGAKKALGLTTKEITLGYLAYVGIALVIGCILGLILGALPMQYVLNRSMLANFVLDVIPLHFTFGPAIIACVVEIVLIIAITYFACANALKMNAIKLLAGPEPPSGKARFYESWGIWKRQSLLSKTIVNNMFNDSKRVIGTLIGIAGCTALIVTSITMSSNVNGSFDKQFTDLISYDTVVYFDSDVSGASDNINKILSDNNAKSAEVIKARSAIVMPDGMIAQNQVVVPTDIKSFNKLVKIYDESGKLLNTGSKMPKGFYQSDAYQQYFDSKTGDKLSFIKDDGTSVKIPVSGFYEFHLLFPQSYMDLATYEKYYSDSSQANAFVVDTSKCDRDKLINELSKVKGFSSSEDFHNNSSVAFKAFEQISKALVALYMVLSVIMAAFVLLNILTMFVADKKSQLIILMINGYSLKYARRYIYSDTIVLTFVGIIFGMILGTVMGNLSESSFESAIMSLNHGICWTACLIGAVCTVIFSFAATMFSMKQIKDFKLTDINQ